MLRGEFWVGLARAGVVGRRRGKWELRGLDIFVVGLMIWCRDLRFGIWHLALGIGFGFGGWQD